MTFTQDLLDALAPMMYAEGQTGNALADYLGGLGKEFELVETWASDTDTDVGWSLLLDVDRCPVEALPWLAQIVGLTLPVGLSAADQRSLIKTTPNWKRGTVGALQGAAAPFLTGNKTVILRERYDGSGNDAPYYLQVITYASETPVEDWPATNLIINGGFETNTTPWTNGSATVTRDTTQSKFGSASGRFVSPGSTPNEYINYSFASLPVGSYATSFWIKGPAGAAMYANLTAASQTTFNFICTGDWQKISLPILVTSTIAAATLYIASRSTGAPQAITAYIDGVQVEANPQSTPYIETNGAIASRAAGQGLVGKALLSQKAGGIIMTYNVVFGQDYQTLKNNYATYQLMKNHYPTYDGVKSDTGV